MAPALLHRRSDDAELVRRVGAGDATAFATLDARHRAALTRYAGSLLRRSEHDAQDVVQDVLIRAHAALRAGDGPQELRPWLYRLTRNRAIDEVRRARWGDEAIDDEFATAGVDRDDPETVFGRRESMRRLVDDLADLPVRQRTALLARELDDQSPEQVAAQLGVSVMAAQKLATRARENLIRTRAARDADCADVRATLLDSHERGVRPSEHGLRHVAGCDACRAYRQDIRGLSEQLQALNPVFGLPLLAGLAKLLGGGGTKAAASVAAIAIVATGGVVVLESDVLQPGDPAPFRLGGVRDFNGRPVTTGAPVPNGNVVVTTRVRVPAGRPAKGVKRSVTLPCPEGMKFARSVQPEQRVPRGSITGDLTRAIPGYSTRSVTTFVQGASSRAFDYTVAIVCRRPDANGSVVPNPRRVKPGERQGRICVDDEYLLEKPGTVGTVIPLNTVFRGQPVAIQRRNRTGRWTRVAPDDGIAEGWVRTKTLCR